MKKQYRKATNIFVMLCMLITIASCNDDPIAAPVPSTKVSFKLQKLNMGDDKSCFLKSSKIDARRSWWYEDNEGFIHLGKSIDLIVELNNGETVKVSIETSFREESKELLTLSEYDTINWNRSWDYRSSSIEIENFWKKATFSFVYDFYYMSSDEFGLEKVKKVFVNGIEKIYVELRFKGQVIPFYPVNDNALLISEGVFKGVIE